MGFLTLSLPALVAAIVLGILLIVFGGNFGPLMIASMILFLVLSAIVTAFGITNKKKIGVAEKDRGIKNVIANGLAPLIFSILFAYYVPQIPIAHILILGFISTVAAITADKFSSEIGVLNGNPTMIFGLKKVKKGTSGGVTKLGLISGFLGSAIITIPATIMYFLISGTYYSYYIVILIIFIGFLGSIFDSMLGYFEECGFGNKYTSNFIASILSGLLLVIIFLI